LLDGSWSNETKKWRELVKSCELGRCMWGETKPDILRMDDGLAFGVDRLRAIGNGQVPAVVRLAWNILSPIKQVEEERDANR
jgi:hypothetical protein